GLEGSGWQPRPRQPYLAVWRRSRGPLSSSAGIPVAIETRPITKREFMEMGAESALIWDLGRAFHTKPSSRSHSYSRTLIQKWLISRFRAANRRFRLKTFQTANRPLPEFRK